MNLHLLRIFVEVIESGGFSAAARRLGISQPAVSKAVRTLEAELDTVLLERQGRRLRATDPGNTLYRYGQAIFKLELEATQAIHAFYGLDRGTLVIGASTTIATYWLPAQLMAFRDLHPGLTLQLVSANTRQIVEALLDGDLDVALVEGAVNDERVQAVPWFEEEMVVIGHDGDTSDWQGPLSQQLWIVRERGSGSRDATDTLLKRLGEERPQTLEVGSNEAVVQAVAAGHGYGFVPRICANDQLTLGRVHAIDVGLGPIRRQLYRLRLPERPTSQAAVAFEARIARRRRER